MLKEMVKVGVALLPRKLQLFFGLPPTKEKKERKGKNRKYMYVLYNLLNNITHGIFFYSILTSSCFLKI